MVCVANITHARKNKQTKKQPKSKYQKKQTKIYIYEGLWRFLQTLILVIQIIGWFELESHTKERDNQYLDQVNNSDSLNAEEP